MKKRILSLCLAFIMSAVLAGCAGGSTETTAAGSGEEDGEGITIVYTNDIHSYIANTVTSDDKSSDAAEEPALRISKIAQMVEDMREEGKNVLLVDDGDEIQGNSYGSIDEGAGIISIMNAAGFQLATPGNHEFDYGMERFDEVLEEADFPYITCNFHCSESEEQPCEAYEIFEIGGKKVAFIGISTPETITSSTPTIFQNENGEFIYTVDGTKDPADLYEAVQDTIDEVEDEADYIIALGHVGIGQNEKKNKISSEDIIENTTGLDAFIDGHSHTTMECETVSDKDGSEVVLTQTGAYLAAVGVMEIDAEGNISTKLVTDYDGQDEEVAALEGELINKVNEQYGQKIAELETELYVDDPDNESMRLVRSQEMNIGDFSADSVYWYYNIYKELDCDVAICNAGGLRTSIKAGDVTENDIKSVQPFGNMICLISATGRQIKDALEVGATVIGEWDSDENRPSEDGGFLHVAGIKYTIDSSIESSVKKDADGMFESVDGEYKVKDIEVYNRETGEYEPLDTEKTYTVGGINYILRNSGNGQTMFKDCEMVVDYSGLDCEIMSLYFKSFAQQDGYALVKTENCPLCAYSGYLINYENPFGAGRITIE